MNNEVTYKASGEGVGAGTAGPPGSLLASEAALHVTLHEINAYREVFAARTRELHKTRLELNKLKDQRTELFDSAPLTYIVVDGEDVIHTINTAGLKLLDAPRMAIVGSPLLSFVRPIDWPALTEHLYHCRETDRTQIFETELQTTAGRAVPVLLTSHPSAMGTIRSKFVRIGITDISERKEKELKLQHYALRLEETTNSLELRTQQLQRLSMQLCNAEQRERHRIADLLHDHVQQILVACKMSADTMIAQSPNLAAKGNELVAMLQEAISELRSLSTHLRPPALRERGLIASLRWLAQEMETKHGLKVHLQANFGIERLPFALHDQLFQIVRELLFNVVKHARTTEAHVEFTMDQESQVLTAVVRDRGRGMELAGEFAAKENFGLATIRERLAAYGGELNVESAIGQGSALTLRLPLHVVGSNEDEQAKVEPAAAHVKAHAGRTMRVLIADDHLIFRQGLVMLLQREPNIEVVAQADDGEEALRLARHHLPDVVLMDLNMPRMDGVEATRLLKAEFPHIGVVGLSMHGEDEMARAIRQAGADDYVSKVSTSEKLVGAIRGSLIATA